MINEFHIEIASALIGIYLVYMSIKDARYGKVENRLVSVFILLSFVKFIFIGDFRVETIIYKTITVLSIIVFYYINRGKIGGADVKILIGLAIALNIENFILQVICAALMALVFIMVNRGFRKKIENVRFVPFIALGYFTVLCVNLI